MKQDLATAYRQSIETDSRSQTRKEKITGITGLTLWVFFFLLEALTGATLQRLSKIQRIHRSHNLSVFERILVSC